MASSLLLVKFTWPAAAPASSLTPSFPRVEKPMEGRDPDEVESVCADSITVSGQRQRFSWRTDEFIHVIMKYVPIAEMVDWRTFIDYVHDGGSFLFYPDSIGTSYVECWMEDSGGSARSGNSSASGSTNWAPKFAFRHTNEFELVLRVVPGGLTHV